MIKVSNVNPGVAPASVTQRAAGDASPSTAPQESSAFAHAYAEAAGTLRGESASASAGASATQNVAMASSGVLKQELSRLQQQLQDAQRRLSMELARPKIETTESRDHVKLLRSRVAGLQSAIQTSTASLAQLVEREGGSPPGKLLNVSA